MRTKLEAGLFRRRILAAALALGSSLTLAAGPAAADDEIRYNRDVRPILAASCFRCHGPDKNKRKARLRLDQEKGIRRAFKTGELESSKAWVRINSDDPEKRMPPPDSHLELKAAEIDILRSWMEAGAKWEGHWAFVPPKRSAVPAVKSSDRVRNPIDAFLLSRLERDGLTLMPAETKERLLRRVTLDLTGLPPTIAEIDAFLADGSAEAYERAVDRLLDSPHYGERMTLAWMDLARYGDTSVFHADGPRDMWPWRDWVIRAYNGNKPFDEFTVEQIAGDLLPEPDVEHLIATGFNRNNATTDEGGAIAEEYRVEYAVDRVKTTSLVWLALSMECGQCHDHKYDPITQEEYYRFFAYFNQASDPGMQSRGGNQAPTVKVPDFTAKEKAGELAKKVKELTTRQAERAGAAEDAFLAWLSTAEKSAGEAPSLPEGEAFLIALDEKKGKTAAASGPDAADKKKARGQIKGKQHWQDGKLGGAFRIDGGNWIEFAALGDVERTDSFSYGAWIHPQGRGQGAVLARMDDSSGYRGWDLRIDKGHPEVHIVSAWDGDALKVRSKKPLEPDRWHHLFATYDGSSTAKGVTIYVDGKPRELQVQRDQLKSTIRTDKPLKIGRRLKGDAFKGVVDDVRFYRRKLSAAEVGALAHSDPLGPLLAKPRDKRTPQETSKLRNHYLGSFDDAYKKIAASLASVRGELAAATKTVGTVMVMKDVAKMRPTHILVRGNYASPDKERPVEPGVPSALPPLPEGAPKNRLGLARWLVQPTHPLTSRVAVNRYWYMLMGVGLVKSLEDFGSQGEWPSHPALLDWLAVDFVESGWNVKRMLRQIVTSSAYRQSSRSTPSLRELDPENRLRARGPRFRLVGEFVRDLALASSELLVRNVGGPGVKPYQPPGLWNEISLGGNVRFKQDKGDKLYRRSMYTYWKRSAPMPSLTILGTPTREKCVIRRSSTNTPTEALVVLNDPQFVEAARKLAELELRVRDRSPRERIVDAFRRVTGLRPRPASLELLERSFTEEMELFRKDPERAKKLISVGEAPREESLDAAEHAALSIVISMIFNLDQTLTRG